MRAEWAASMKLISNWRAVLKHAWSVRLLLLAGLLSGLEAALQLAGNFLGLPKGIFALLAFIATGGAFVARLLAQSKIGGEDA